MSPVDIGVAVCGVLSVAWLVVRYRRATQAIAASRDVFYDGRSAD